jgi:hypothetical protein
MLLSFHYRQEIKFILIFQVVQLNKAPLIITFVGTENLNVGHVFSYEDEVEKYIEEYKAVLEQNLI